MSQFGVNEVGVGTGQLFGSMEDPACMTIVASLLRLSLD
jgi:hypothetical protein